MPKKFSIVILLRCVIQILDIETMIKSKLKERSQGAFHSLTNVCYGQQILPLLDPLWLSN